MIRNYGSVHEVTRESIRRFAMAAGVTAELHHDVEAARSAGYADLVAPPYFFISLGFAAESPFDRTELSEAGMTLSDPLAHSRVRAGETTVEWFGSILAGDRITVSQTPVGVVEKSGRTGTLRIHTFRREYRRGPELLVREDFARIAV